MGEGAYIYSSVVKVDHSQWMEAARHTERNHGGVFESGNYAHNYLGGSSRQPPTHPTLRREGININQARQRCSTI